MFVLLVALALGEGEIERIDKRCDALNTTTICLTGELKDLIKRVDYLEHLTESLDSKYVRLESSVEIYSNKTNTLKEQLYITILVFSLILGVVFGVFCTVIKQITRIRAH